MRLEQHLSDTCSSTEVAVDLKRGMSVEHVGISPLRIEQHAQHRMRMIALCESRPDVDTPRKTPACGFITAYLKRASRCRGQLRRIFDRDLIGRMQCI